MLRKIAFATLSVTALAMFVLIPIPAATSVVSAVAPNQEKTSYLGNGKVEIEFIGDVEYRNPKVTVKDSSGKQYKASIYHKDDDELTFKIKNYKAGKKYKYTIIGIRKKHTSKYDKVKGNVSIKKESKKNISLQKAKNIAVNDAVKRYQLSKKQVTNLYGKKDWDDGVTVYEVEFRCNNWEYEYTISMTGKILERDRERD